MSPGAAALTAGELQSSPVPAPIHDDSLRSDSPSTKRAKFQQPKHIDIASSNDGGKDVGQSLEDLKEPVVDLTDGAESPPPSNATEPAAVESDAPAKVLRNVI